MKKLNKLRAEINRCPRLSPQEKESILLDIEALESSSTMFWKDYYFPLSCFSVQDAFRNTGIPRGYWYLLDDVLADAEHHFQWIKYQSLDIS